MILETIYETARNVWRKVIDTITNCYDRWLERLKYIEEHEEYLNEILQHDCHYQPTQPDIELLTKIKEYIGCNYPNGIEEKLAGLSEEELVEKFKDVINDASELMGVSLSEINFYTPESESEAFLYGFYRRDNNSININLAILLSGKTTLVTEQFFTIFHEMKHALQWAVVNSPDNYNYPPEQVVEWAYNFLHYISYVENDEAYLKQPLERDTFGMEEVLKGNISIKCLKS